MGVYALNSPRVTRGDFRLIDGEREIVRVDYSNLRERARFEHGGQKYTCALGGMIGWTFRLCAGRETLAKARRNWSLRRFEIDGFGCAYRMKSESRGWTPYVVREAESGREIGRLERKSVQGRNAVVRLPVDMPVPLKAFFGYLAVVGWRRMSGAMLRAIRPG